MAPENDFAKRLMMENGVSQRAPKEELMTLAKKIAREERILKRLKYEGMIAGAAVVLLPALAFFVTARGPERLSHAAEGLVVGLSASIYVILLFGIGYVVRRHFLNQHKIEAAMLRVEAQLADARGVDAAHD